jgi:hypothetical protein
VNPGNVFVTCAIAAVLAVNLPAETMEGGAGRTVFQEPSPEIFYGMRLAPLLGAQILPVFKFTLDTPFDLPPLAPLADPPAAIDEGLAAPPIGRPTLVLFGLIGGSTVMGATLIALWVGLLRDSPVRAGTVRPALRIHRAAGSQH